MPPYRIFAAAMTADTTIRQFRIVSNLTEVSYRIFNGAMATAARGEYAMRSIVLNSALIAVGAMATSVLVAFSLMRLQGLSLGPNGLLMSLVCPLVIGWPVSAFQLYQRRRFLDMHARLARAHTDLHQAHARLAERASRDPMIGMLNRESALDAIAGEQATGGDGALLIVDADHFKAVNDTYGHQAGDVALVAIANAIRRALPRGSIVGRIGGEEFAVYLPGCRGLAIAQVGEDIRRAVAATSFRPSDRPVPLSVSIGGTHFSRALTVSQALRSADRRLYLAKRAGRDCVVTQDDENRAAA
ncbi:GGDEF domain-containing protein [Nitratireductor sp. StC3]|uniref:GGDEF domain-containing protein n=1 Tax=Nitratireductor sp. StC3 TaxID=2126741 RepID=UPI001FE09DBC|nr:GGDEF domain-containing protein [Nitratireductor sp. StC3]